MSKKLFNRLSFRQNPTLPAFIILSIGIILLGYIGIVSALSPGDLDTTFDGGTAYTDLSGGNDTAYGVAIQPADDKVVVVGESAGDFGVIRYTNLGALDGTFGAGGIVTTTVTANVDIAQAVALDSSGNIIVAGYSETAGGAPAAFVVARYSSSGVLDAGFGSSGIFSHALGGTVAEATAVAIQTDGQIIVAGTVDGDFAVARLNEADGSLDSSFNGVGYVTANLDGPGRPDTARALVIQPSGKIVLGGFTDRGDHEDFSIARFTTNGVLDTTFGFSGKNFADPSGFQNDRAFGLGVQSDGGLVMAGYAETGDATNVEDYALARFSVDGVLDNTFGTGGTVVTANAGTDWAYGLAVQATDKFVVAGFSSGVTTKEDFHLIRYNSDGSLDTTFGTGGIVTTDIGTVEAGGNDNSQDQGNAIAIHGDKIVVVGQTDVPLSLGRMNFAAARYESQNNPPTLTNIAKSGNEGADITFTSANFSDSFNDPDGDSLIQVKITSLPANGTLKLSGVAVSANDEILTALLGNLTFTPDTDWFGDTSFGWNGQDGLNYAASDALVNIAIANVNDAPSFTLKASPNQTVTEDTGLHTVAGMVTGWSAGPNEDAIQTVDFLVSNDNTGLFSVQPGIDASGTLSYTLAANQFGTAVVSVRAHDDGLTANGGVDTSAAQTFSITVNGVNDTPTFTGGGNQAVNEDAGATTIAAWATNISAGPNETQTIEFGVQTSNNLLFKTPPSISVISGDLTFESLPDLFGSVTVTATLSDDGGGANVSDPYVFTLTINSVNDAPSFTMTASPNQSDMEDDGAKVVSGFITGSSPGPANESGQTVTFAITTTNDSLFAAGPMINASNALSYTLASDANGSATVFVRAQDDGSLANGGVNTSPAQTFTIDVTALNDPPSLTIGAAPTVNEDAGPQSYLGWATNVSAGPADESGQSVFLVGLTNDNNALFADPPSINLGTGELAFTPADDASGSATVTFSVQDNGGTILPGDDDMSGLYSFVITVNPVNDPPSFTKGANQSVKEDAGAQTKSNWATNMSPGPADESAQTWQFNVTTDNDALFAALPAIDANGHLTYTPAADANGSATVTVEMQDHGGTAFNGDDTSGTQSFVIEVTAVNDAPSFTVGAELFVDEEFAASGTTEAGWATNISAGPADENGQGLTFNVSTNNDAIFSVLPAIDSSSGDLTFTALGGSGDTALITVTLSDDGGTINGGSDESAPQTFTITVTFVNDAPTFTKGADQTVDEDAGLQTVAGWATAMDAGSPTESGQTLTFNASNDNATLFASQPAIDAVTGDLTYTPADDAHGSATVTVTLSDDGGTANSGADTSAPQTFVITVNPINDAPTVAAVAVSGQINAVIAFTAVDFTSAFTDVESDSLATVKITSLPANGELALNGTAVAINQEIAAANLGQLTFTPDTNWNGDTSFAWTASDGTDYALTGAMVNITVEQFKVFLPLISSSP